MVKPLNKQINTKYKDIVTQTVIQCRCNKYYFIIFIKLLFIIMSTLITPAGRTLTNRKDKIEQSIQTHKH